MKPKYFIFALVIATVNLFGDHPCIKPEMENCLEADIIVIGGGAAGCVVMNKLSENGRFKVLGIEAGKNLTNDPDIQKVGLDAFLLPATAAYKYFWMGWRQMEPAPMLNGRINGDWVTGMLLGGGSSVNGLYYGRGSNAVYSRWEKISGSDNWSLDKILETFDALENYDGLTSRGFNGPVHVLQTPTVSDLTANVLLPATKIAFPDLPVVNDYNDPDVENCIDPRAQWLINATGTKRVSSATAFLNNNVMTPEGKGVNGHTLRVIFDSVVTKIVFNKHGRATKVKFYKDGRLCEAHAKKAVILSCGINSSKILQLSGVGPEEILKQADVEPLIINENVGRHLKNHPLMGIAMVHNLFSPFPEFDGIPKGAPYAFTIHNVYLPEVFGTASDPRMLQILFEFVPKGPLSTSFFVIGFELLNPKSEGSVTIQSNNPFQIVAANDGIYQNPIDFDNMKKAIQKYIQPLLLELKLSHGYIPLPTDPINLVIFENYSDQSVEQYVKNNTNLTGDSRHYTSHCKMAPYEEGGAIDGDMRVYGTTNCFVIDNSICPEIPDMNTTGPALMIGLRGSEIIKDIFRKCKKSSD